MRRLLIDSEVLSHAYVPQELLFREEEKAKLLRALLNDVNTFIYGPSGSGKTALLKLTIEEFNSMNKARAVYVDAALCQTTNSILKEILSNLNPLSAIPRSNSYLIERLRRMGKRMTVCIDHFEQLKDASVIDKLLSLGITVILVSNSRASFERLSRYAVSLIPNFLHVARYTDEQVYRILAERARQALSEGCCKSTIISSIAERSGGNATLAISLLKACIARAESENRRIVREPDIPNPINEQKTRDDEQILLELMKERKRLPASKLYELYVERAEKAKSERTFREYMRRLRAKGLVRALGEKRWRVYEFCGAEA